MRPQLHHFTATYLFRKLEVPCHLWKFPCRLVIHRLLTPPYIISALPASVGEVMKPHFSMKCTNLPPIYTWQHLSHHAGPRSTSQRQHLCFPRVQLIHSEKEFLNRSSQVSICICFILEHLLLKILGTKLCNYLTSIAITNTKKTKWKHPDQGM